MLTPAQLPPHPSSIPSLTPLAQKVLAEIRKEKNACIFHNVSARRSLEAMIPFPARSEREFLTTDDIFDDQSSEMINWSIHFPNSRQVDEGGAATLQTNRIVYSSATNIQKLGFQENNQPKLLDTSNVIESKFNLRNAGHLGMNMPCDAGGIEKQSNDNKELSPDMEFDDMEVYANPFGEPLTNKNTAHLWPKNANLSTKIFSSKPSIEGRQRNITFKEIKKKRYQGPSPNKLSKIEPTDQSFKFANVPTIKDKFKLKLDKYRVVKRTSTKNRKITSYFKPLENLGQNTKGLDDSSNNVHKKSITTLKEKGDCYSYNNNKKQIIESATENDGSCEKIDVVFESAGNYLSNDLAQTVNNNNKEAQEKCFCTLDGKKSVDHEEPTNSNATISFSEPIESLFVNTQDPIEEKSVCKNNDALNVANELGEELSIKLYEEQGTNVQSPYKNGVDNLYSFTSKAATNACYKTKDNHRKKIMPDLQTTNEVGILYQNSIDICQTNQSVKENNSSGIHLHKRLKMEDKVILPNREINVLDTNLTETHKKHNGDDCCVLLCNGKADNPSKYIKNQTQTNHKSHNIRDQNYIEVNCDILNGKLVKKPTNLKQSTLDDWNTCFPVPESNQYSLTNVENNNEENNIENALFKTPQAPLQEKYHFKQKNVSSEPNIKLQSEKLKYKVNDINFGISLSTRPDVNSESNSDNVVHTSLIKSKPAKHKVKKKPRFVAPIVSQQTPQNISTDIPVQKYSITVLDEAIAKEILKQLRNESLQKVLITVTFKEGYTLLNKPPEPSKKSRCLPSGVIFLIYWSSNQSHHYWLPLLNVNTTSSSVAATVHAFLSQPQQVICFESQAIFMLLKDVLHYQNISKWFAHDPLIGCWLLDPDNPPKDFAEAALKLDVNKDLLTISAKADTKTQACDLLSALDKAMESLENKLFNVSLWTVFTEMETKLTPLLAEMECSSILLDVEKLDNTAAVLKRVLKQLEQRAHQLAGRTFQLNSHKQLREVLYDQLKLDENFNITIKQTEHGLKSTSEAVLSQLKEFHPLPNIVLEYRHLQKVKSTYVDGLIQYVKSDNTIGTTWEQVGAATGRITSKNPNLQAIPKTPVVLKDGEKIYLRAVFKAREGYSFLGADFQQIEFRVFAHFSQDNTLLQAFREGGDIFEQLAVRWLGEKGVTEREKTKRIVYSVMYGAGPQLLAEYLHVDMAEATHIIRNFTDIFPCLRSLPRTVIAQCRTQGYLVTLSGRRRLFPNIRSTNYKLRAYSERQAINFLIQGSAADICKAAMLECETAIRTAGLHARLLLQIHDELIWEVADSHLLQTARTVQGAMEHSWDQRLMLKVPVPVCVSAGKTQADMEPITDKV